MRKKLENRRTPRYRKGGNMDFEKIYYALIKIIAEQHNVIIKTKIQKKEVSTNEN